jgi:hypothetical protein
MSEGIVSNKIRCRKCDDVIESTHRHDFKWCKCGAVAVDGGKSYLKRCGDDWEELSEPRPKWAKKDDEEK